MMKTIFFFLFACCYPFLSIRAEYVSVQGFRNCCQCTFERKDQPFFPAAVKDGDAIFVKTRHTELFFKKYHPLIRARYILVTHFSDDPAPGKCAAYLDDPKLIAWFAQNVENFSHPKLIPIPIGLNNLTMENGNHLKTFNNAVGAAHKMEKTSLLYMNFQPRETVKERSLVYSIFKNKPFCICPGRKPFGDYLKHLSKSQFVLSPRGIGLDCYRTWESLYMGAIPIVKASSIDQLFDDLPVLIINDWKEITEEFLSRKWDEMKTRSYNLSKLEMSYWKKLIDSSRS